MLKKKEAKLQGEWVLLRRVRLSDATKEYAFWLNDKEVNRYLESRFKKETIGSIRSYVKKVRNDPQTHFFAIIRKDTGKHIGNIKLGPVDEYHGIAGIGIMIGDKQSWGKGFATEAIQLVARYAFNILKLHKLCAGAYANNIGSVKSLLKAGFVEEGRQRAHNKYRNSYIDRVLLARWNK
ncbi:MAG: GNAT family protein [Candidatus Wildermuthbacteria bacterium]|nr:GNAT family protein [Candidatus Wildermuthbacteria bacterium]